MNYTTHTMLMDTAKYRRFRLCFQSLSKGEGSHLQRAIYSSVKLIFIALLLVGCSVFDPEQTYGSYLTDYPGDQLVVEGVLSPEGLYVKIGKTQPPDLPFTSENISVTGETRVIVYDLHSGDTSILGYDANTEKYTLNQFIDTRHHYGIQVSSAGLADLTVEPLSFNRPLSFVDAQFVEEDGEFIVEVQTLFAADQYVMIQPLIEDSISARSAAVLIDLDELYLNQCGFNFDQPVLSYSNTCFALDTASLRLRYVNAPTGIDRFSRPETGPQRIGIRVGSISASDYQFFSGLNAPNNFLEAYLTEQPLTDYNVEGGFGRVVVLNGRSVWKEL